MKEIKNTTEYTEDLYREFNRIHYIKNTKKQHTILLAIATYFILAIICIMVVSSFYNEFRSIGYGYILIFIISIIISIIVANSNIIPDKSTKAILKQKNSFIGFVNEFIFTEDSIQVKNQQSISNFRYNQIYECIETNKFVFIYLDKMQAFLIDKSGTEDQREKELINLLKSKAQKYEKINK